MPLPNRGSRRAMMLVAVVAGLAGETVEISFLALDLADQFGLGRAVRLEVVVAGDGADILQFHLVVSLLSDVAMECVEAEIYGSSAAGKISNRPVFTWGQFCSAR